MNDFLDLITADYPAVKETTAPTIVETEQIPTFDVTVFDRFYDEIDNLESLVVLEFATIANENDSQAAVATNKDIQELLKALEKERKKIKEPYLKVTKLIDGNVKELRDKLESIQQTLKSKIKEYLEKKQLEILAKTQEQIETIETVEQAGQAGKNDEQPVVIPEISQAVTTTETGATAKLDTVLEWEITDFRALPEECFIERKEHIVRAIAPYINQAVKAGITHISGVKFFQTTTLKTK